MHKNVIPVMVFSLAVEAAASEHDPQKHVESKDFATPNAFGRGVVMASTSARADINLLALYQPVDWNPKPVGPTFVLPSDTLKLV